ncbi:Protein NLRC5 [Pteropus alecto]|uniref:Protein NLRC5 n=1 Tax=Pteropus alecto TaxID=9402 RepID=L5KX98_PTEAL|nr:Protein NLRC5 [Pteropus alecto]
MKAVNGWQRLHPSCTSLGSWTVRIQDIPKGIASKPLSQEGLRAVWDGKLQQPADGCLLPPLYSLSDNGLSVAGVYRVLSAVSTCQTLADLHIRIRYSDDLQVPGVAPASSLPLHDTCPQAPSPGCSLDGMTYYVQELWPDFPAFHLSRPAHHRLSECGFGPEHMPRLATGLSQAQQLTELTVEEPWVGRAGVLALLKICTQASGNITEISLWQQENAELFYYRKKNKKKEKGENTAVLVLSNTAQNQALRCIPEGAALRPSALGVKAAGGAPVPFGFRVGDPERTALGTRRRPRLPRGRPGEGASQRRSDRHSPSLAPSDP